MLGTAYSMTTTQGYDSLKVTLTKLEPKPFELMWRWYKQTWYHLLDKDYDANDPECQQAVQDVLANLAIPVPKEQLSVEYRFEGMSRVCLAQLTRQRVAFGAVVLSQMPQRLQHEVIVPLNIAQHPEFGERAIELAKIAEQLYEDMYDAGVPPQDARYLSMHGQTCSGVVGTNFTALQGFYSLRLMNELADEINLLGRLIRQAIIEYATANMETHGDWLKLCAMFDCMDARSKKHFLPDRVFGNTGRFVSGSDRVPSPDKPDNLPDYDFRKSAFYSELIKMYHERPELLFPGEHEMVERWLAGGTLTLDGQA